MHSIIVFGFPIILVSFEALLRSISNVDTFGFVGPTLAAAAISFTVPLTKLKEETFEAGGEKWVKVPKWDARFVYLVWFTLLLGLLSWFWVCTLSLNESKKLLLDTPAHLVVGAIMYVISIVLCGIKEVVSK
ncbi:TPA: hypothetical protein ACGUW8_004183 [Vibrio vulnificus]